jgi:GcrA cell cycle regulator
MNEQITPVGTRLALHETFIGPPTEARAAAMDISVLKRTKRKLITTIALTIDTCRWPFGDPADSDFHYCGELPLVGQPYCDMHDAQSSQAVRRKKTAA